VPICLDPKAQREQCLASIKRNLGLMKWKLRKVDIDIKETLTCVLARRLYRSINNLPNLVTNKALMNVACGLRNAWEIVEPLALRANLQSRRQTQLKPDRRDQPQIPKPSGRSG